jgi:hypothetical protein
MARGKKYKVIAKDLLESFDLRDKDEALLRARIWTKNKIPCVVHEITTDGEDIISNKVIFDNSDEV